LPKAAKRHDLGSRKEKEDTNVAYTAGSSTVSCPGGDGNCRHGVCKEGACAAASPATRGWTTARSDASTTSGRRAIRPTAGGDASTTTSWIVRERWS